MTHINSKYFKRKKVRREESISIHESSRQLRYTNDSSISGEGYLSTNINLINILWISGCIILLSFLLLSKTAMLQIRDYETYNNASTSNSSTKKIIFANRGNIFDRNNTPLAWNNPKEYQWDIRETAGKSFGHILGHVSYPRKDSTGTYFRLYTSGKSGIEGWYDSYLRGENGAIIVERDSTGKIIAERFLEKTKSGEDIHLTIDADIQKILYKSIQTVTQARNFQAGVGAVIDIKTGDIYALVSYPDYNIEAFSLGDVDIINTQLSDEDKPLFDRSISGLYTPGSTVKPFFGIAALEEGIIKPNTSYESTGSLVISNPYNPDNPSIFMDWKAHGYVNISEAIAHSSNVFFYIIGGGHRDRKGLGIKRIEEYANLFHFIDSTHILIAEEPEGVIPSPDWKQKQFNEDWFLGDTYNTIIGQYGFLLTPLQIVRAVASIANDGIMNEPFLVRRIGDVVRTTEFYQLPISNTSIDIMKEAMRLTVTQGSATRLKKYPIAVKTGTAQLSNKNIHSLLMGFFPYHNPQYAFVIIAENGPQTQNGQGAAIAIAEQFFTQYYNALD